MSQNTLYKIIAVKPAYTDPNSFIGSLVSNGYNRFPGTSVRKSPYKEPNGAYRTGLDTEALYIQQMSPEDAEIERAKVSGLYELAKKMYNNIDLSPTSDFYTKLTDRYMGETIRCPFSRLSDSENVFNMNKKEDVIMFAYLRVHPSVAPSKDSLKTSSYGSCRYYVHDSNYEDEASYRSKQKINKAKGLLGELSVSKMKKIGRQLGLPIDDGTSEQAAYKMIDDYINETAGRKGKKNAELFTTFVEMREDNLNIRDIVSQAVTYGVLRKLSNGNIMRGDNLLGKTYEDVVSYLTDPKNQEDFFTVEEEIKAKKSIT